MSSQQQQSRRRRRRPLAVSSSSLKSSIPRIVAGTATDFHDKATTMPVPVANNEVVVAYEQQDRKARSTMSEFS